jgi:hypothetical protein
MSFARRDGGGFALRRHERRVIHRHLRLAAAVAEGRREHHLRALAVERQTPIRGLALKERGHRSARQRAEIGAVACTVLRRHRVAEPLFVFVEGKLGDAFDARFRTRREFTQDQRVARFAARTTGTRRVADCGRSATTARASSTAAASRCRSVGSATSGCGGVFQHVGQKAAAVTRQLEGTHRRHTRDRAVGQVHNAHAVSRRRGPACGARALNVCARSVDGERDEAAVRAELRGPHRETAALGASLKLRPSGVPARDLVLGGGAGGTDNQVTFSDHRSDGVGRPLAVVGERRAGDRAPLIVRVLRDRLLAGRCRRRRPRRHACVRIRRRRHGLAVQQRRSERHHADPEGPACTREGDQRSAHLRRGSRTEHRNGLVGGVASRQLVAVTGTRPNEKD